MDGALVHRFLIAILDPKLVTVSAEVQLHTTIDPSTRLGLGVNFRVETCR